MGDWMIAHDEIRVRMPRRAPERVLNFIHTVYDGLEEILQLPLSTEIDLVSPFSLQNLEQNQKKEFAQFLIHTFIDAMVLCYGLLSGRPLEGSEHLLYYAIEEKFQEPMNHGKIIALNTLMCLKIQDDYALIKPELLRSIYSSIGLISPETFEKSFLGSYLEICVNMPGFAEKKEYPFSIWNLISQEAKSFQKKIMDSNDWIFSS